MNLLKKPVKSHLLDAFTTFQKTIVYDRESIDCISNPFLVQYDVYGTVDSTMLTQNDKNQLQKVGCKSPELFSNNAGNIEVGGIWIG